MSVSASTTAARNLTRAGVGSGEFAALVVSGLAHGSDEYITSVGVGTLPVAALKDIGIDIGMAAACSAAGATRGPRRAAPSPPPAAVNKIQSNAIDGRAGTRRCDPHESQFATHQAASVELGYRVREKVLNCP